MERPFDNAAMLHFIRDSLFRSHSPLHHEFSSALENFIAERIASRESEWFPCFSRDLHSFFALNGAFCGWPGLVTFTACRRSLQILKPRASNWSNASMRCRLLQQMLLRQLINESPFCSPRWRMQHELL